MTRALTYKSLGDNGRLGNQLFQIAAAYSLAERASLDLILPPWNYASYFSLPCLYDTEIGKQVTHEYREPYFHYTDPLLNDERRMVRDFGPSFYLLNMGGYFQSEKYFLKAQALQIFTFEKRLKSKCESIMHDVRQTSTHMMRCDKLNIVSLHMRFGDYVGNAYYADLHENEYYLRAINHIRYSRPNEDFLFLVFSDNKGMAMEKAAHLKSITNMDYLLLYNNTEVEDMCLQSMCDHHVIANSSFSWWSSYLCPNEHKTVIAPAKWFGPQANLNTKDLYRSEMIQL